MHYRNAFIRGGKPPFRAVLKYKDENGTWRQIVRRLEATGKAEAKREMAELRMRLEEEHEDEERLVRENVTVAEYVERYVSMLEQSRSLERATVNAYRSYIKHMTGAIGRVKLQELTPDQVQAWEAKLLTDGLSPVSVRKMHVFLKSACKFAVERDLLLKNPCAPVKPPKAPAALPNALDDAQRRRVLTYLDAGAETPFNLAVLMALSTGMREGELCGLRWADVSFESRNIWVRRSIGRDNGGYYVKEPKTRSSIRDIPISAALLEKLKSRYDEQETSLVLAGIAPTPERMGQLYVLGGVDGSFMTPHGLWRPWKALADSMGLVGTQGRRPTFHDLRHTFATFAIAEGVDVKTVSSIMGHSNAAMTLNVYASADADAKRAAAETIDRVLGRRLTAEEFMSGVGGRMGA